MNRLIISAFLCCIFSISSIAQSATTFSVIDNGKPLPILFSSQDMKGVQIACQSLAEDFNRVCGEKATILTTPSSSRLIIAGTLQSEYIKPLLKNKIDKKQLSDKTEKFLLTTISNPLPGVDEAVVIAGSDMRGTIYGIYELSEMMGVSPWYYWADVPVKHLDNFSIDRDRIYTDGEPAVRYRGIFLNDEAPCLTTWVKNTFGTNYGGKEFYKKVFELILRLKGNFMWPAMWGWAFYADDPDNSRTASEMGIIMGTSHHEPMARNHQEWARHRAEYGAWDYTTNQAVLDRFFREGMERAKNTEDLITIGMRGDGDTALGGKEGHDDEYVANDKAIIAQLEKIVANQRKIISEVTGRPAEKRQQVWALYKEVQRYYDMGMKIPDDAIILLSDDNWGDVRRLPSAIERKNHKGGFGMYYHVDYVGAPRNSKWLNVTPIQHMWEQLQLTYDYGVDRLWVLNVGDLKPMEYPIDLFMDMAWNPEKFTADNLLCHTRDFCRKAFGEEQADEAARLLNLYSKYAGMVTAEMLDSKTYNLSNGEWEKVCGLWSRLEADALYQYQQLPADSRDAYSQIILFPAQAMSNLYQMYYAQAKNHQLYALGDAEANLWANRVYACFKKDSLLCLAYNKTMSQGKWNGMMIQKHIGYTSWNDNFPKDVCPATYTVSPDASPSNTFMGKNGCVIIEAAHFSQKQDAAHAQWTVIPHMGRTLSGVSLMPYTENTDGACLDYKMQIPKDVKEVTVHIITNATLAFKRSEGHRYMVGFLNGQSEEVNFNAELKDDPEHAYSVYYPTVARRVIEKKVKLRVPEGQTVLRLQPMDPGVVFEKLVIDYGGYEASYLFGNESTRKIK